MELFTPTFIKVLAILAIMPLGYFLKRAKVVHKEHVPLLRDLFVKVVLPASIFAGFLGMSLTRAQAYFPLLGFGIVAALALVSFVIVRMIPLSRTVRKVFLVAMPTLAPATVAYPFLMELYGEQGLVTMTLFNIGNVLFLFSLDQMIVSRMANHGTKLRTCMRDFVREPVVWATAGGLVVSYFHVQSSFVHAFFTTLAGATSFVVMMMLGLSLEWKTDTLQKTLPLVLTKTGLGMVLGAVCAMLFNLQGLDRVSLIIFALVPPSTVTYAFMAHEKRLPASFDAALLAIAMPIGAVVVGLLMSFQEILLSTTVLYAGLATLAVGLFALYHFDRNKK